MEGPTTPLWMVPFPTTYASFPQIGGRPKLQSLLSQEQEKFTDFKFGRYIHSVSLHPNESPLKILEKRERTWAYAGTRQIFWVPLSGTDKAKLQTSNFVCIFTGSIGLSEQKSIKNVGKNSRGRIVRHSRTFSGQLYRAQVSCQRYCSLYFHYSVVVIQLITVASSSASQFHIRQRDHFDIWTIGHCGPDA